MDNIQLYTGNGVARQGDVLIYKLPADVTINRTQVIDPKQGKLILLEGEMTGHHHHIAVLDRPAAREATKPTKTSKAVEGLLADAAAVTPAVATMYRDPEVANQLVKKRVLERADLMIAVLEIKGGGEVGLLVEHQEHDPIRLLQGNYYIGRQIESAGAEERVVRD